MKKAILFYAVIVFSVFRISCQTLSPGIPDSATIYGSGERIRLFTDRNIYCVNERIFFTANYSCIAVSDSVMWSRVLYVELITWNGIKLGDLKLKMDTSGSSGSLKIPGNLLSGNYYLRAYTKWMRNFSVNNYAYQLIKIVNPFTPEIDAGPAETMVSSTSLTNRKSLKDQVIQCSASKWQYHPKEKAEVEFYIQNGMSVVSSDFCVSVTKAGSMDTTFLFWEPEKESSEVKWKDIEYLPEIAGISISGKIMDKNTGIPKVNQPVNLSEPANGEFFSVYQTGDDGKFLFSLPEVHGKYDFFIQSEASDTIPPVFLIDNSFCNRPVFLPYVAFSLSEKEKVLIRDMMVNMQLNEKFLSKPDTAKELPRSEQSVAFYGSGVHTYFTKKYIEMPGIEDFFNEIVLEANVVYNKGKAELKISGNTGFSNYPPLILLDNVMVDNDDRLFRLPLDRIEKVEAIESGYMAGSRKYSGLISIYSKNRDFAGMELNKNGMFFSFDMLSDEKSACANNKYVNNPRIPDRRNVLYWNPEIQLTAGQKVVISFFTSESKGDYEVYIFRKDNPAVKVLYGTCHFSVK